MKYFITLATVAVQCIILVGQQYTFQQFKPDKIQENFIKYPNSKDEEHPQNRFESKIIHENKAWQTLYKSSNRVIRLDSTTSNEYRRLYTYDHKNRLTKDISYTFNSLTEKWDPTKKCELTYSDTSNRKTEIVFQWNEIANDWVSWYKYIYDYDENGNETDDIAYKWSIENNNWYGVIYKVRRYDNFNQLIYYLQNEWDYESSEWQKDFKYAFEYEENKQIKEWYIKWSNDIETWDTLSVYISFFNQDKQRIFDTSYTYMNSENMFASSMTGYLYDNNNNLSVKYGSNSDSYLGDFVPSDSIFYEYNNKGLLIRQKYRLFDGYYEDWVDANIDEFEYDGNGNLTLYTHFDFSIVNRTYKEEYTRDDYNNVLTKRYYGWDPTESSWYGQSATDYVYDYRYLKKDIKTPYNNTKGHKINSTTKYEWDGNSWIPKPTAVYHYSVEETSFISSDNDVKFVVYPNPTSDHIAFDLGQNVSGSLQLLNTAGIVLLTTEISNNDPIDISQLKPGLYIYRVSLPTTEVTGKVLIK